MSRDIPGYYYNEEKGKYFKIQPNHQALIQNNEYSTQAVKRKRDEEERLIRERTWERRVSRERVERVQYDGDGELQVRLGSKRRVCDAVTKYWASTARGEFTSCGAARSGNAFAVDEEGGVFVICALSFKSAAEVKSIWDSAEGRRGEMYLVNISQPIGRVAILDGLMAKTAFKPLAIVERLAEGRQQLGVFCPMGDLENASHVNFDMEITINDLATSTHSTDSKLAVAHSEGVSLVEDFMSIHTVSLSKFKLLGNKEQMVVRFKDRDPSMLMCGARSGKIRFADLRSQGQVLRLKHDSAVSALRSINDDLVLVNGLSSMKIYDLRHTKAPQYQKKRGWQTSTPWLCFAIPDDRTSDRYGPGFDYDPEMNVVAVGSSNADHGHRVSLYSAGTGKMITSTSSALLNKQYDDTITCLKWAKVRDSPKSLMLSCNGVIEEWTPQGVGREGQRKR